MAADALTAAASAANGIHTSSMMTIKGRRAHPRILIPTVEQTRATVGDRRPTVGQDFLNEHQESASFRAHSPSPRPHAEQASPPTHRPPFPALPACRTPDSIPAVRHPHGYEFHPPVPMPAGPNTTRTSRSRRARCQCSPPDRPTCQCSPVSPAFARAPPQPGATALPMLPPQPPRALAHLAPPRIIPQISRHGQ